MRIDFALHIHQLGHYASNALLAGQARGGGEGDYVRCVGRTPEERAEQRKAARLSLDTSAHAGSEFRRFVRECSVVRGSPSSL